MMRAFVDRDELLEAFNIIKGMRPASFAADAQVAFENGQLVIDSAGNSVTMEAHGEWPGVARVPMSFFVGLAKRPPDRDAVEFRVEGERFHIGSTSIACAVQSEREGAISIPLDPPITTLLKLAFTESHDLVEKAGLTRAVRNAEVRAGRRVDQAAVHLKTLGIEAEELAAFVREMIIRKKP